MAFARSIPLSSSNWTCLNYEYLYGHRPMFNDVFTNVGSSTNFEYALTGVKSLCLVDSSLLILKETILGYNQRNNIFPANQQDVLSGTSFSDFSTSNTILSSYSASSQDIIHIPLANENQLFNVIPIERKTGEDYYSIYVRENQDKIGLSVKRPYHEYTFVPDVPQEFYMESMVHFDDVFPDALAGLTYCETDSIQYNNEALWLSGGACSRHWVKTYFLGNNSVSSINMGSTNVSGRGIFTRLGDQTNHVIRSGIETLTTITDFFTSSEEVTIHGIPNQIEYFDMDGSDYIQIDWSDPENVYENSIKVNLSFSCLYRHKSVGGQLIGNRNVDKSSGFSFELNTGFNSFQKTIPYKSIVQSLNENNLKIGQREFDGANIRLVASGPSGSGIRWLYDSNTKTIHKLLGDNFSPSKITLASDAEILHMETDYQNNLWIMDQTKRRFQSYDTNGHLQKNIPWSLYGPSSWDMFYIPILGTTPIPTFGKVTDFDSKGNLFKLAGTNIRKNDDMFYSFGSPIQDFYVDLKDRVWVIYNKNQICVIDGETGKLIGEKVAILGITNENNARMTGWSRSDGVFTTQILLMDNGILLEMNEDLSIIQKTDFIMTCERNFTNTFRGDWCGFKLGKRQNYMSQPLYVGFANTENPFLTLDFSYHCSLDKNDAVQHGNFRMHAPYRPNTRFSDWNGIGFVVDNNKGIASIFINGNIEKSSTFPSMSRLLRHEYPDNNRYNPILIGAYNGKIGTRDQYTGTQTNNIIGDVACISIYSQALSNGEISTIYKDDYNIITGKSLFTPLKIQIPTKDVQSTVVLSNFLKNSFPGHRSNFFDINVYGFTESDSVKSLLEDRLVDEISKVIPAHVELRRINWK
jgi:hypothetical protein